MAAHTYKLSKSRRGSRRSHHALKAPGFSTCPRCTQPMVPHRICSTCGYYRRERVVDMRKL